MNTQNMFPTDKSERLKFALKVRDKTEESCKEDVNIIKEWLQTQPHLPETPCDDIIINFLLCNKFSIEKTKQKLDMYYSVRSLMPEFYKDKNPKSPDMKEMVNKAYIAYLPKVTKEGYRVTMVKIVEEDSDNFDAYNFFAHSLNTVEVRILEDFLIGDIVVYDLEFVKFGHVVKFTPTLMKQSVVVLENVFSSPIKEMHFINAPHFVDGLVSITKKFIKPKLADRIHVHETGDSVMKYIPREILPKDYGGEERSFYELNELWKQKFIEYQERFDALEKMRTNEDLRPTPLVNDDILGFYGNFKKLNVD